MNILNPRVHDYNEITWTYPKPAASYKTLTTVTAVRLQPQVYIVLSSRINSFLNCTRSEKTVRNHNDSFEK